MSDGRPSRADRWRGALRRSRPRPWPPGPCCRSPRAASSSRTAGCGSSCGCSRTSSARATSARRGAQRRRRAAGQPVSALRAGALRRRRLGDPRGDPQQVQRRRPPPAHRHAGVRAAAGAAHAAGLRGLVAVPERIREPRLLQRRARSRGEPAPQAPPAGAPPPRPAGAAGPDRAPARRGSGSCRVRDDPRLRLRPLLRPPRRGERASAPRPGRPSSATPRCSSRSGLRPPSGRGADLQSGPYCLLATREWLLLVPRSREFFDSISINALGFAGALLVRNEEQLRALRAAGPLTALRETALPREGVAPRLTAAAADGPTLSRSCAC